MWWILEAYRDWQLIWLIVQSRAEVAAASLLCLGYTQAADAERHSDRSYASVSSRRASEL